MQAEMAMSSYLSQLDTDEPGFAPPHIIGPQGLAGPWLVQIPRHIRLHRI